MNATERPGYPLGKIVEKITLTLDPFHPFLKSQLHFVAILRVDGACLHMPWLACLLIERMASVDCCVWGCVHYVILAARVNKPTSICTYDGVKLQTPVDPYWRSCGGRVCPTCT